MYLMNEKDEEGQAKIPFTDEPRLHPEDIQDDWVFLESKVPLKRMIADHQYTIYDYLNALHGKRLTALYNRGVIDVCWRSRMEEENLISFMTSDPEMALGKLQAITGEGIYIKRGFPIHGLANAFKEGIVENLRVSMKYIRDTHGVGIERIVGWNVDLPPSHKVGKESA